MTKGMEMVASVNFVQINILSGELVKLPKGDMNTKLGNYIHSLSVSYYKHCFT